MQACPYYFTGNKSLPLLFIVTYSTQNQARLLGEDKYRPSLKPNPMACVCMYVYIMYACVFYICMYIYLS